MIYTPDIALTEAERELLNKITFDSSLYDDLQAAMEPMAALAASLLDRQAIPEVRLLYFTDPERNPTSRGKSWQQIFESNGTAGNELLSHPNFLKFLYYFIHGPKLPEPIIRRFAAAAANSNGRLSSHDIQELTPQAKAAIKSARIEPNSAAEEFHKLALEYGATASSAEALYRSVRSVRLGTTR